MPRTAVTQESPDAAFFAAAESTSAKLAMDAAKSAQDLYNRKAPTIGVADNSAMMKHLAYWRYCSDPSCELSGHIAKRGWIVIGPGSKGPFADELCTEFARAIHGESLEDKYGCHKKNMWFEDGLNSGDYDPRFPFGSFGELFKSAGGVFEMPIEQFVGSGYHRLPELAAYRDDLLDFKIIQCDQCSSKREFLSEAQLNSHRLVMHKDSVQALAAAKAMGEQLALHNNTNNNNSQISDLLEVIAKMSAKIEALERKE